MTVTKFLHSCLLVEDGERTFLFDPGNFTDEAGVLNLKKIQNIDYLLITHEHADHMSPSLIKKILDKFPDAKIITNDSARAVLEKEGILVTTETPDFIKTEIIPHEKIFGAGVPKNIKITINSLLTHPGDSFEFNETTKILSLPLQAPWGDVTQAAELAVKLKPEIILPIHDWHWKDEVRVSIYKRLEDFFSKQGIKFIPLETGVPVEV